MNKQVDRSHVVVLSGAGMSAESGLKTFRDHDGLRENHRVEDVATPQACQRDRALVLKYPNPAFDSGEFTVIQVPALTGHGQATRLLADALS